MRRFWMMVAVMVLVGCGGEYLDGEGGDEVEECIIVDGPGADIQRATYDQVESWEFVADGSVEGSEDSTFWDHTYGEEDYRRWVRVTHDGDEEALSCGVCFTGSSSGDCVEGGSTRPCHAIGDGVIAMVVGEGEEFALISEEDGVDVSVTVEQSGCVEYDW